MDKPWIDYTGQSSAELIALHKTHRIDSILCALEWAIQAKHEKRRKLSPEERLVLSLMALNREVQNGGFNLFFYNSSRKYVPVIVAHLETIGARKTAVLAGQAIAASKDPNKLDQLDKAYFKTRELESKLWKYVYQNRASIDVLPMPDMAMPVSPPAAASPMKELWLSLPKGKSTETLDQAMARVDKLARSKKLAASAEDIEGAALWHLLSHWQHNGRHDECETIGERAMQAAASQPLMDGTATFVIEVMLDSGRATAADRWAIAFLKHVPSSRTIDRFWWADMFKARKGEFPKAEKFFEARFPRARRKTGQ